MTASHTPMALREITVLGHTMAYAEMGEGPAIVFQHGNPTSSYLWRNIMPGLADLGRCIAVDLIGMGGSQKLPGAGPMTYSFEAHARHLDAAWDALGVGENVVLVLHDWGSALGFDWARRHADRIAGIAYMEGIVMPIPSWEDWPVSARSIFEAMRSPAGEQIVLDKNAFVERVLPSATLGGICDAAMAHYRAPFNEPGEGRRPTLDWPRQIPIAGEPAHMVNIVKRYSAWLNWSSVPKLFIDADPGAILVGPMRAFAQSLPNQTTVTVPGAHFIQEDSPDEITAALRQFVSGLGRNAPG